jgi:hypothetical protein
MQAIDLHVRNIGGVADVYRVIKYSGRAIEVTQLLAQFLQPSGLQTRFKIRLRGYRI